MRIWLSGYFVVPGQVGGAEEMFYGLARGMGRGGMPATVCASSSRSLHPDFASDLQSFPEVKFRFRKYPGNRFINEQYLAMQARGRADAILYPNYFTPPLRQSRDTKVVTVVHDVQFKDLPQNFAPYKRAWLEAALRLTVNRADTIVAVSNFSAERLARHYGPAASRKIQVIHNPITWQQVDSTVPPSPVDGPYILSVAAHYPHKNLNTLIHAFSHVQERVPGIKLILIGQSAKNLRGHMSGFTLEKNANVHALGYLRSAELAAYYRNASLVALPTLYEGFGMPAVEALGWGVPVLASKVGSIPEVTLGFANYVEDPLDEGEWCEKMSDIVLHPNNYQVSVEKRARIRAQYDVEKIARRYAAVISATAN